MGDDRAMGEEDFAVLADVAYELFGDAVDPRELSDVISKMDDASEVHVSTGAAQKSHRKKLVMNTVGQGLNALAMGAGTHALIMAGRDPRLNRAGSKDAEAGKKTFARAASAPYRAYEKTRMHRVLESKMGEVEPGKNAKYAVAAAGGALALHGAELVGDSIAARALHDQRKAPTDVKSVIVSREKAKEKAIIKKALADIVDARRRGIITTDKAIEMSAEIVAKVNAASGPMAASHYEKAAEKIVPFVSHTEGKTKALKSPKKSMAKRPADLPKTKGSDFPASTGPVDVQPTVSKSESPDLTWSGEISKMDTDKRQVFGFCTVTHVNGEPVIDLQGDYVPLEEIEKAAYTYVIDSRKGGDMHQRNGDQPLHTSDLVESFVVTPEKLETMGLDRNAMPHGWWVGFKVNDDKQWEMVKSGERAGFSIHGSGRRIEKMLGA
jgi:hypothetical protein